MTRAAYQAISDDFLAIWQVENAGSYDLHGGYVTAAGEVITTELAVQTGDGDQLSPALVYDAAHQTYLLAWQDTRDPSGIYARRWHLPQAEFSAAPLSGPRPLTVTFSNQTADRAAAVTYLWDFGDGTGASTLTNPEHVYAERGAYDVTLTASAGSYSHTLRQANYIFVGLPHPTVIDYTYDGLSRLTEAHYSTGQRFQYAYDPVGNRTAQTRTITSTVVTTYQYDEANRLTNAGGVSYTWDDNGNLVNDGVADYAYNQANRLTAIEGGSSTVAYAYNGDGVRLQQIVNDASTTYAVDLAAPLPVVLQSQTDELATRYVYALGTRPLAQYVADAPEYLLADALGSVRQIVDVDGNVTLAESYEPYGSLLSSNGTASSMFAYAGEQIDTSGLVFLRARYLQPALGIFLAHDPWSGDQPRPGSMNGWNYVEGDPINFSDSTGWCRDDPFGDYTYVDKDGKRHGDRCSEEIDSLEKKYQITIQAGYSPYVCWVYGIDDLKPGTPIPWTLEELDVLDEALGLTKAFLDQTAHPFNGSIGERGYLIRRVHDASNGGHEMGTGTWLGVHTEVTDKVFGGTPNPAHEIYHASLIHEFFHAFDYQQNPWVSASNPTVFNNTPEPDGYCGATKYACGDPYENFADNAAVYALESMKRDDALSYFPNTDAAKGIPLHRVEGWSDLDASGHSKRGLFFNQYFFPNNSAKWLKEGR